MGILRVDLDDGNAESGSCVKKLWRLADFRPSAGVAAGQRHLPMNSHLQRS
jgi:hypothetical protein